MPSNVKKNPLNLNGLQLRTLTLLQELAQIPDYSKSADEADHILITGIPHPHGDHFHLGHYVVAARDATGLKNESAWTALERKGLIKSMFPVACVLTPLGRSYDTGLRESLLHGSHH